MVRWMRKARIASGKFIPAISWSKDITEYVKKVKEMAAVEVYIDIFGKGGLFLWGSIPGLLHCPGKADPSFVRI